MSSAAISLLVSFKTHRSIPSGLLARDLFGILYIGLPVYLLQVFLGPLMYLLQRIHKVGISPAPYACSKNEGSISLNFSTMALSFMSSPFTPHVIKLFYQFPSQLILMYFNNFSLSVWASFARLCSSIYFFFLASLISCLYLTCYVLWIFLFFSFEKAFQFLNASIFCMIVSLTFLLSNAELLSG